MNGKTGGRWALALLALVVLLGLGLALYSPARPKLAQPDRNVRQQKIQKDLAPEGDIGETKNRRAQRAQLREFFLDYPDAKEPDMQLRMAVRFSSPQDPDYDYAASQIEQVILDLLAKVGPDQTPTLKDFQGKPLSLNPPNDSEGNHYKWEQKLTWTEALHFADVDGDGHQDVIIAPGITWSANACFLFRHTPQGWKSHRLLVGTEIMGIWVFDVQKGGPKVIEVASLADSEYDPNLFVDAFVWQKEGIRSVLSTKITHGFQLDHKDVDGKGVQAIRLFGKEAGEEGRELRVTPSEVQIYRWDGARFSLQPSPTVLRPLAVPWLQRGQRLFGEGKFKEAAQVLQQGIALPPKDQYDYMIDENRQGGWYYLGLCRAFLGDREGAIAAMSEAGKTRSQKDVRAERAKTFISVCSSPSTLPQALAAVGQGFRVIEQAASSHPNATPREIMEATGLPLDSYQDVSLGGQPAGIAQIHWPGGSVVLALRRNPQNATWSLWPLGYALEKPLPDAAWWIEPQELFYLPHPPALQLHPTPTRMTLGDVYQGPSLQLSLRYEQGHQTQEHILQWKEDRFVLWGQLPVGREDLLAELNRLEAALFQERKYQETLDTLLEFEKRVRSSGMKEEEKTPLLLEVFYHQALCYRKMGQEDRAAVTYAALARGYAKDAWGELARQWVRTEPNKGK